jgi:FlaA1/EpsC-like NDP-sugar epimerase
MVELSRLTVCDAQNPTGDIELVVTGLRPGDNLERTPHPRIMKAHEKFLAWTELKGALDELRQAMRTNDVPSIRQLLQRLVNGYQANGDVVDWVHIEQARQA